MTPKVFPCRRTTRFCCRPCALMDAAISAMPWAVAVLRTLSADRASLLSGINVISVIFVSFCLRLNPRRDEVRRHAPGAGSRKTSGGPPHRLVNDWRGSRGLFLTQEAPAYGTRDDA